MSDSTPPPSSETASDKPTAAGAETGPGRQLAAARKSRGLTQEEVGDSLNLAPHTVEWLETDNYEKLPASAFTQGYLRNYAKHLSIDPDAIIAAYQKTADLPNENWTAAVRPARTGFAEYLHRYPGVFLTGACLAVGLIVVALLIAVWPEDTPEEASAQSASETPVDAAATQPTVAGASTNRSAAGAGGVSSADQPDRSVQPAGRFSEPVLPSQNTPVAVEPVVNARDPLAHIPIAQTYPVEGGRVELVSDDDPIDAAPRRLTPQGSDRIRIRFDQDCWFEVNAVGGEQLFATLGRAGNALELVGQGPFQLVMGFATGVDLRYNDQAIDVTPHIRRNNRASLVIGQ